MPVKFSDPEQQRAYWRDKSARRYARIRQDPDAMHNLAEQARSRYKPHPRRQRPQASCVGCGVSFQRNRPRQRYCTLDCYRHHERPAKDPRIGKRCAVWFRTCEGCARLFAARRSNAIWCDKDCRLAHFNDRQRDAAREYQRRTRYTAIRYWAIDDSPAALELAATYFELRQQLRRIRHA